MILSSFNSKPPPSLLENKLYKQTSEEENCLRTKQRMCSGES